MQRWKNIHYFCEKLYYRYLTVSSIYRCTCSSFFSVNMCIYFSIIKFVCFKRTELDFYEEIKRHLTQTKLIFWNWFFGLSENCSNCAHNIFSKVYKSLEWIITFDWMSTHYELNLVKNENSRTTCFFVIRT